MLINTLIVVMWIFYITLDKIDVNYINSIA
nr:MAG TPA_asm: hypothetical protein [Bacteriophage sp.]